MDADLVKQAISIYSDVEDFLNRKYYPHSMCFLLRRKVDFDYWVYNETGERDPKYMGSKMDADLVKQVISIYSDVEDFLYHKYYPHAMCYSVRSKVNFDYWVYNETGERVPKYRGSKMDADLVKQAISIYSDVEDFLNRKYYPHSMCFLLRRKVDFDYWVYNETGERDPKYMGSKMDADLVKQVISIYSDVEDFLYRKYYPHAMCYSVRSKVSFDYRVYNETGERVPKYRGSKMDADLVKQAISIYSDVEDFLNRKYYPHSMCFLLRRKVDFDYWVYNETGERDPKYMGSKMDADLVKQVISIYNNVEDFLYRKYYPHAMCYSVRSKVNFDYWVYNETGERVPKYRGSKMDADLVKRAISIYSDVEDFLNRKYYPHSMCFLLRRKVDFDYWVYNETGERDPKYMGSKMDADLVKQVISIYNNVEDFLYRKYYPHSMCFLLRRKVDFDYWVYNETGDGVSK